ncbi:MAG TPA: acetyl-CoA carboxylase biotin carboxylase subunit [Ignavibacteria bacterium]|nr:acetyl-CoA carboxylase biotin carboxylase subunit [Ignavibacteria bacterium]
MIKKILIANRGEIAVRIIKTAKEMGIKTAAVYSDFDRYSLYTKYADEAFYIGPSPASESYLLADKIIETAKMCGADAIHPGYGFLSERAYFSKMCKDNGIIFIGPPAEAIEKLGDKTAAKTLAMVNGVPTVPGTAEPISDAVEAKKIADEIGYPLLIKASAGGGGKGMRVVREGKDFESALRMSQNEAKSSFGDDSVFIEKYIEGGKHIEFQILADQHGNVIHLGERECSMQRRLQKIIEETPSVVINDELRNEIGERAKKLVKAAGYTNAGTMEFIMDKDRNYYFLEMNTRLQVEHPITEMRTDTDLVREQILIASGEKLSMTQEDVEFGGHTIECRICAEDPDNNFLPSIGRIDYISRPSGNGIREDSGIEEGDEISIYYDSMISKLITHGKTREIAIRKMDEALRNYIISGLKTNIEFLHSLLNSPAFMDGDYNTQYVERIFLPEVYKNERTLPDENTETALSIAAALFKERKEAAENGTIKSVNGHSSKWAGKKYEDYR